MSLDWTAEAEVNPPFTPSDLADIWEWWEPEREGLADNDPIAILTGQVAPGAGHNWTQSSADQKPQFHTNQINGLGTATFGSNDNLANVNPSALTAAHIFLIVKNNTEGTASALWDLGTSGNTNHYAFTDNHIYDGSCSTTRRDVGDPVPTLVAWRLVEIISTPAEWTYLLDGLQLFTTGTNTVAIRSNCVFGAKTGALSAWSNGRMAGLYICSAKLDSADRNQLVDYLNNRFNLSVI